MIVDAQEDPCGQPVDTLGEPRIDREAMNEGRRRQQLVDRVPMPRPELGRPHGDLGGSTSSSSGNRTATVCHLFLRRADIGLPCGRAGGARSSSRWQVLPAQSAGSSLPPAWRAALAASVGTGSRNVVKVSRLPSSRAALERHGLRAAQGPSGLRAAQEPSVPRCAAAERAQRTDTRKSQCLRCPGHAAGDPCPRLARASRRRHRLGQSSMLDETRDADRLRGQPRHALGVAISRLRMRPIGLPATP
jgi:hypothetical protein